MTRERERKRSGEVQRIKRTKRERENMKKHENDVVVVVGILVDVVV